MLHPGHLGYDLLEQAFEVDAFGDHTTITEVESDLLH